MHTNSYDVTQLPFYFKDGNSENTCIFNSKVKPWHEALRGSPPHHVHAYSPAFPVCKPQPPSPLMSLCFWGPRYNWQLRAAASSSHSTSLSSQLWTCKHHTFFLSFRSCCNVLLRKKPICKSGQSRNGSADLSASAGDSLEVQFCLWNFALAAWVQLKMTVMIVKGLLYLKVHTVFCVKDHAVRVILWR